MEKFEDVFSVDDAHQARIELGAGDVGQKAERVKTRDRLCEFV